MKLLFGILFILVIVIVGLASESKKKTRKERYGEAVSTLTKATADSIDSLSKKVDRLTESKEERERKDALETVRWWSLRVLNSVSSPKDIETELKIGYKLGIALKTLNISEQEWKRVGREIYYIGQIMLRSRSFDGKKSTSEDRQYVINSWSLEMIEGLLEGLDYFGISKDEWIKYGDTVLDMYNILECQKYKDFGLHF